jgi:hypothetical protein
MRWIPNRPDRSADRRAKGRRAAPSRGPIPSFPRTTTILLTACAGFLQGGCGAKAPPETAAPSLAEATATLAKVAENGIVDSDVLALRIVLEEVATALPSPDKPILELFDELIEAGTHATGSRPTIVKQKAAALQAILSAAPGRPGP